MYFWLHCCRNTDSSIERHCELYRSFSQLWNSVATTSHKSCEKTWLFQIWNCNRKQGKNNYDSTLFCMLAFPHTPVLLPYLTNLFFYICSACPAQDLRTAATHKMGTENWRKVFSQVYSWSLKKLSKGFPTLRMNRCSSTYMVMDDTTWQLYCEQFIGHTKWTTLEWIHYKTKQIYC